MATEVLMPKLGLTMTEGTIDEWKKNVGDTVKKGEILFSVETDKLTNDVEAEADGVLLKILVPAGETVACKTLVGWLGAAGEAVPDGVPAAEPLPGFKEVKPVVYSSIYPLDSNDYEELRDSMEKLRLNDASLVYEKDNSIALGNGFRCGFLGLLHLEIIEERLERDFDQSVIFTAPSVRYKITLSNGEETFIDNPSEYPEGKIRAAEEPYIKASIITPGEYIGQIMALCNEKRGVQTNMQYLDEKRAELTYEMPLAEVLFDFYDRLKSYSRGYASFDYEIIGYKPTELVKIDILINGKSVDALSQLTFKENASAHAHRVCHRLKGEIARQQFKVAIQGAIGSQIIARETVNPVRKDVLAKCYGGDITRKRKLLEKQKEGKKRMKMIGDVELPQSAFLAVLKSDEDEER